MQVILSTMSRHEEKTLNVLDIRVNEVTLSSESGPFVLWLSCSCNYFTKDCKDVPHVIIDLISYIIFSIRTLCWRPRQTPGDRQQSFSVEWIGRWSPSVSSETFPLSTSQSNIRTTTWQSSKHGGCGFHKYLKYYCYHFVRNTEHDRVLLLCVATCCLVSYEIGLVRFLETFYCCLCGSLDFFKSLLKMLYEVSNSEESYTNSEGLVFICMLCMYLFYILMVRRYCLSS